MAVKMEFGEYLALLRSNAEWFCDVNKVPFRPDLLAYISTHMNQAVFAFRRYEDSSLSYTGIDSHPRLRSYGLYDTVVAVER